MNFETIYSKEIFFEDKCWKKCGGGFCCNNENDNFDFQHIKTKGSTIFYLPREYYYANKNLKTFQNQYGTPPHYFKMKIKDITIGVVSSKCELLGKCKDKIDKPFLCRAYPFLPVYDYNNNLKTLIPASIFDIIYQIKEFTSPCKVNDFQKNFDHYNDNKFFLNLDVYSKFYLKVLEIFYKVIKKNILMETKNFTKNNKKFWRVFEKLYLSGLIFSSSTLKNDIYKEYLKAVDFDKNFNLLDEERYLSF